MGKVKTTIYLDEELLREAKVWAARKDMRDSQVFELALRRLLGKELLDGIWQRNTGISEATALDVSYAELRAQRQSR